MTTKDDRGHSGPRSTQGGLARRGQILAAAREVLAEMGYAAASVGRIAQRAGVSKGVVSYHFATKDEILRAVAIGLFQRWQAHVAERVAAESTPAVRLEATLRAELEYVAPRRVEFLAMAEVLANHRDEDFSRAFEDVSAAEAGTLTDLLADGQARGEFRAFDIAEVSHLIVGARNAVLDRWAGDAAMDLDRAAAALIDFVESAVTAAPNGRSLPLRGPGASAAG